MKQNKGGERGKGRGKGVGKGGRGERVGNLLTVGKKGKGKEGKGGYEQVLVFEKQCIINTTCKYPYVVKKLKCFCTFAIFYANHFYALSR